jgi:hypothetical protein
MAPSECGGARERLAQLGARPVLAGPKWRPRWDLRKRWTSGIGNRRVASFSRAQILRENKRTDSRAVIGGEDAADAVLSAILQGVRESCASDHPELRSGNALAA